MRYSREHSLEVAIYAARTTDLDAATHFGMPRRSVTAIRARLQSTHEFRAAKARLVAQLADAYAGLEEQAIVRARQALADPATTPRDVARIGEWVSQQRALTTGDPTSRTESTVMAGESMTWQQQADLRDWLDRMLELDDDAARAWLASGGLEAIRTGELSALGDGKDPTDA